jgi:hypothetical protein
LNIFIAFSLLRTLNALRNKRPDAKLRAAPDNAAMLAPTLLRLQGSFFHLAAFWG